MEQLTLRKAWIAGGAIVATAIVAFALIRLTVHPATSPRANITATSDPVLAAYRAKVNDDVNAIDVLEFHKLTCKTRDLCISQMQDMRAATVALDRDLATTSVPPVLAQQGVAMQAAAQKK